MMKPLYRTHRFAVLNLAERGLLGCRSRRSIGVVVTEGVVEQEWARGGDEGARGTQQGKGRRRKPKGVEGGRVLAT